MKKSKFLFLTFSVVVCLIAGAFLTSCGGGDDDKDEPNNPSTPSAEIVGTWSYLDSSEGSVWKYSFILNNDNTCIYREEDLLDPNNPDADTDFGTYIYDALTHKLIIAWSSSNGDVDIDEYYVTISGDFANVREADGGDDAFLLTRGNNYLTPAPELLGTWSVVDSSYDSVWKYSYTFNSNGTVIYREEDLEDPNNPDADTDHGRFFYDAANHKLIIAWSSSNGDVDIDEYYVYVSGNTATVIDGSDTITVTREQ